MTITFPVTFSCTAVVIIILDAPIQLALIKEYFVVFPHLRVRKAQRIFNWEGATLPQCQKPINGTIQDAQCQVRRHPCYDSELVQRPWIIFLRKCVLWPCLTLIYQLSCGSLPGWNTVAKTVSNTIKTFHKTLNSKFCVRKLPVPRSEQGKNVYFVHVHFLSFHWW